MSRAGAPGRLEGLASLLTGVPMDLVPDEHAAVIHRWQQGDRFGVACVGDALLAEEAFRIMSRTAQAAFGNPLAHEPDELAVIDVDRVVVLAERFEDVPAVLARRCTAVLVFGDAPPPPPPSPVAEGTARDEDAALLRILAAAGCADHGLDIAAVRLRHGLARDLGARRALQVIEQVVVAPRRVGGAASTGDPDGSGGSVAADQAVAGSSAGAGGLTPPESESGDEEPTGSGAESESPDQEETGTDIDGSAAEGAREDVGAEPGNDAADDAVDDAAGGPDDAVDDGSGDDVAIARPRGGPPGAEQSAAGRGEPSTATDDEQDLDLTCDADRDVTDAMSLSLASGAAAMPDLDLSTSARTPPRSASATRHLSGRRGSRSLSAVRGIAVRDVELQRAGGVVSVPASLRRALRRHAGEGADTFAMREQDLRGVLRRRRGGRHTVVVIDGSSSLGRRGLGDAAVAADRLVQGAASARGRASVVLAAGPQASVLVAASTSAARIRQAVQRVPAGGGTPLAHGIQQALTLLAEEEPAHRRILVISDGVPTVGMDGRHAAADVLAAELTGLLVDAVDCCADVAVLTVGITNQRVLLRAMAPWDAAGVRRLTP